MPYKETNELPDSVKNSLPQHAQTMYMKAFNSAWDEYKDSADRRGDDSREEVSHKVAWSAVKNKYKKLQSGKWEEK